VAWFGRREQSGVIFKQSAWVWAGGVEQVGATAPGAKGRLGLGVERLKRWVRQHQEAKGRLGMVWA